mmetsp:Transcript_1384/g.4632  ORF Transcript_1384/g.4632 Transcript_1384/m.4632 type:complete len:267 (+) Transcript_1384:7278-8078(+)
MNVNRFWCFQVFSGGGGRKGPESAALCLSRASFPSALVPSKATKAFTKIPPVRVVAKVSNNGNARNKSSRAPETVPPGAPDRNHLFWQRKTIKAFRAEQVLVAVVPVVVPVVPVPTKPRVSRLCSNSPGTNDAAARHFSSGISWVSYVVPPYRVSNAFVAFGEIAATATALSSTPAPDAGLAYKSIVLCVAAIAVTGHSCSTVTPNACNANSHDSLHPSPRTTGPCGAKGASFAPPATGSNGHPSNSVKLAGLVFRNMRHSCSRVA